MLKGRVKWFNETKGYGFIESETGSDVFVHRNGLKHAYEALQPNQEVEFDTQMGDKGLFAKNVKSI
ncbi:MAG: cold-shock protein [Bacteroidales bacterium]